MSAPNNLMDVIRTLAKELAKNSNTLQRMGNFNKDLKTFVSTTKALFAKKYSYQVAKGTPRITYEASPGLFRYVDTDSPVGKAGAKQTNPQAIGNMKPLQPSTKAGKAFAKIGSVFKGIVKLPFQPFFMAKRGLNGFIEGLGGMTPELQKQGVLTRTAAKVGSKFGGAISRITKVPKSRIKALGSAMKNMAGAAMMGGGLGIALSVLMQLIDAINPFKGILQALTTIFGVYGTILSQAFMPLITKLFETMLSPETINLFELMAEALAQIVIAFLPLIDILSPFATLIVMALLIPLQLLAPIIQALAVPLGVLGTIMQGFTGVLLAASSNYQTYMAPVFQGIQDWFQAISNWYTNTLSPAFTNIKNGFITLINGMIWALNFPANTLNAFLSSIGSDLSIPTIPSIPMLANGGIVLGPTLALIGERGPEKVVPLDRAEPSQINITINGNLTRERLFELQHELWLARL